MNTLIDADFDAKQEEIKSKVAVLYFTAAWCAPCRALGPIMNTISEEFKVNADSLVEFFKVDIDENIELAERFDVRAVPTLVMLKNGVVIGQSVGLKPKAQIVEAVNSLLLESSNDNAKV